jgi:hypothetical protein
MTHWDGSGSDRHNGHFLHVKKCETVWKKGKEAQNINGPLKRHWQNKATTVTFSQTLTGPFEISIANSLPTFLPIPSSGFSSSAPCFCSFWSPHRQISQAGEYTM